MLTDQASFVKISLPSDWTIKSQNTNYKWFNYKFPET